MCDALDALVRDVVVGVPTPSGTAILATAAGAGATRAPYSDVDLLVLTEGRATD
jgi:UTP:GlnB (protein PII) uridylyltransferase